MKNLKARASIMEHTGPTACGIWCFGLSCGCSSCGACSTVDYDLNDARASSKQFEHHDGPASGVYMGHKVAGRHRDIVSEFSLKASDEGNKLKN